MTEPLAPQYNPSAIESTLYAWWQARGLFAPEAGPAGRAGTPYVIMMPPPNVTSALHMGHGLNYLNVKPVVAALGEAPGHAVPPPADSHEPQHDPFAGAGRAQSAP